MAKSQTERIDPPQQQLYCPACKQEFAAYRFELTAHCPRCGRVSRMPLHRHVLRLAAVVILVVLALVLVAVHVL
jgi:uncharacterized paraquat-inducible protein A